MQFNVSLRSLRFLIFAFLFLITFDSHCCAKSSRSLHVKDNFLVQFAFAHKNTSYSDGKQFVFYANPSVLYMVIMAISAAATLTFGTACTHFSFEEINKEDSRVMFWLGLVTVTGGGVLTKVFFDAIGMKIDQIEYIKFDDVGIYEWGKLRAKWEDISSIYLTEFYYNDITKRKASFSDKNANDLFVVNDYDVFLPVTFDDFLSISEYYLNKPKTVPSQV